MRKFYFVVLLLHCAGFSFSQEPFREKFVREMKQLSAKEKRAYTNTVSRQALRSVASNNFDVSFYRCEWDVDPTVRYIKGKVTSYFKITAPTSSISYDLHAELRVDSIKFHNSQLSFSQTANHGVTINFPAVLPINQRDSVSIYYQGVPPNEELGTFITYNFNGLPVLWTLSEPYGSKDWWPCKNGLTDKADSIDIVITAPQVNQTSSNGLMVNQWVENGKTIAYWKHRYPIASYLVAISVAPFVVETDTVAINGKQLPLKMYAYPNYNAYYREATAVAKLCLPRFSGLFSEYPFIKETYSQTQYEWGGGMEHQTNSFITGAWDQLVAHELAHQWFGNKVTCRSWQDIWLNEGFASYSQHIFVESFYPSVTLLDLDYHRNIIVSEPNGSLKVDDTTNSGRIFDFRLTYAKGSYVVHMLRWRLGDSLFYKAIQQYLNDPLLAYGTVSTPDLKRHLESVSGQDFTEFLKDWYEGQGFPSYQVEWSTNKNNWLKIKLNQTTSHTSVPFFEMPVPILLRKGNQDTTVVLNHTSSGQEFWINPGFVPDTVIFDPELWILSDKNTVTRTAPASQQLNDLKIYPNPVDDKITISFKNPASGKLYLRIINSAGQLVYQEQFTPAGRDELIELPAQGMGKGIYWLEIKSEQGFKSMQKLLKK